jgi:hypothetical protein
LIVRPSRWVNQRAGLDLADAQSDLDHWLTGPGGAGAAENKTAESAADADGPSYGRSVMDHSLTGPGGVFAAEKIFPGIGQRKYQDHEGRGVY